MWGITLFRHHVAESVTSYLTAVVILHIVIQNGVTAVDMAIVAGGRRLTKLLSTAAKHQ